MTEPVAEGRPSGKKVPRSKRRRLVFSLGLVLGLVVVPIIVLEVAGRLVFRRALEQFLDIDHRMAPNRMDTNSDGIRSSIEPDQVRETEHNIVFLGDSFAYGYRMPPEEALPQVFEKKAREALPEKSIHVFNFGWVTSSPLLSLRLLQDIGHKYKPDTVMLLLDAASDFHDDQKYVRRLERKGVYRLLDFAPATHVFVLMATRRFFPEFGEWLLGLPGDRFFVVNAPLDQNREYLSSTVEYIDRIASFAEDELGADFYLLVIARSIQYTDRESPANWEAAAYTPLGPYVLEPFRFVDETFSERDWEYFSLLDAFQQSEEFPLYFYDDPHWNTAGTDLAADAILDFCHAHGCFE